MSCEIQLERIRELRSNEIASVKVTWEGHSRYEATREPEKMIRNKYRYFFIQSS